jgi:hypothetical protein
VACPLLMPGGSCLVALYAFHAADISVWENLPLHRLWNLHACLHTSPVCQLCIRLHSNPQPLQQLLAAHHARARIAAHWFHESVSAAMGGAPIISSPNSRCPCIVRQCGQAMHARQWVPHAWHAPLMHHAAKPTCGSTSKLASVLFSLCRRLCQCLRSVSLKACS